MPDDAAPDTGADDATDTGASPPPTATVESLAAAKAEADKWKDLSRKHEKQAKTSLAELERLRESSMSEQDKAIADAVKAARADTLRDVGAKLVDAEVRAACATHKLDADALLEGLDRSRFITDDGEPDRKAIESYLDRLSPQQSQQLDLGQGARPLDAGSNGVDMNSLLRKAAGRAG